MASRQLRERVLFGGCGQRMEARETHLKPKVATALKLQNQLADNLLTRCCKECGVMDPCATQKPKKIMWLQASVLAHMPSWRKRVWFCQPRFVSTFKLAMRVSICL